MIRKFKRIFYGWSKSDKETYRQCYDQYGGSVNVHPDVIDFIVKRTEKPITYFQREKNGQIVGGYPLIDNRHVGAKIWNMYPISYDDVLFPLSQHCRAAFPERCNRVSPALKNRLININYKVARKGTVCLVKDTFSAKSEKNRRNEYRRFIAAGGCCIDQQEFSAIELAKIYTKLFHARFMGDVRCHDLDKLVDIITELRHLIFGHLFFIKGAPCAMDLIFRAASSHMIYFDVPNGGVDPTYSHLSLGSLLMWKNIHAARELCHQEQKKMIFSIGAYEKKWDYKLRWANMNKTGKAFF